MNRTASPIPLDDIDEALKAIAAGRPVVVVDDADRENEGDWSSPPSGDPRTMAFMIRHTSGVVCVPMLGKPGPAQPAVDDTAQRDRCAPPTP